jgi:AcrR family transcriptional regulator
MRTDAAETRRAILEAATAEFSRHGLAGARVDRIAAEAGCSKERLYANFGDKRSLFTTVLNGTFETMGDAASRPAVSIEEFALAVFDHMQAHPDHSRLIAWARLEGEHDWEASVPTLRSVQDAALSQLDRLRDDPAVTVSWSSDDIFALVMSLARAWQNLPGLGEAHPGVVLDPALQREIVREAVRRLTTA